MQTIKPKISIIVPVYNAEKTLHACISSICAQSFTDFELLLIDDGSKDKSLSIMRELAELDGRIRIFTKKNGGQSSARNMGIGNAQGDFIAFVDSDDTIEIDMLRLMYNNAIDTDSQLSVCGVRRLKKGAELPQRAYPEGRIVFDRAGAIEKLLAERYILFSVCDKLYSARLFDDLRFEEGVIHEDVLLPFQVVIQCERVVCEMKPLYNYVQDSESTTRSRFRIERFYDIVAREKIVEQVKELFPQYNQNALNIKAVGYLNMTNLLVFESRETRKQFLEPVIIEVRKYLSAYLSCPFLNYKKKLGLFLLCVSIGAYKLAYKLIGGGQA